MKNSRAIQRQTTTEFLLSATRNGLLLASGRAFSGAGGSRLVFGAGDRYAAIVKLAMINTTKPPVRVASYSVRDEPKLGSARAAVV